MPLSNYLELRASILAWLARPGDPLVEPAVPDFIRLFEVEANRRIKAAQAEKQVDVTITDTEVVPLPADFTQLRVASIDDVPLSYVTPDQLPASGGGPDKYTIVGLNLILGPAPSGAVTVHLIYQSGVPPLSDTAPTNWLLASAPDLYLFGSLCMAEPYIGHDERVQLWVQAREAAFTALFRADQLARWPGQLQIRAAI